MMPPMLAMPYNPEYNCIQSFLSRAVEVPVTNGACSTASSPAPEALTCVKDHGKGLFRICWRADAKQLRGKNSRLVSPSFQLPFGEDLPLATFRLMVVSEGADSPVGGQSFCKS